MRCLTQELSGDYEAGLTKPLGAVGVESSVPWGFHWGELRTGREEPSVKRDSTRSPGEGGASRGPKAESLQEKRETEKGTTGDM